MLVDRCASGWIPGIGIAGLPDSIAATRFGSTPSGPTTGDIVDSPKRTPPSDRARRCADEPNCAEAVMRRRLDPIVALPLVAPLGLPNAGRESQDIGGEPELKEAPDENDPPAVVILDDSGEGFEGTPRPSALSSLRFPAATMDIARSDAADTEDDAVGSVEAESFARRGTAGGPIEPEELVTELFRVSDEAAADEGPSDDCEVVSSSN